MKLYGVVVLDVVSSRKVKDRKQLQVDLHQYIHKVNEQYSKILAAPIRITLGDEWQVITSSPAECYNIVSAFQQLFWKEDIEIYAGIGIGSVSTDITLDVGATDGPCFHLARQAIDIAKAGKNNKRYISSKNNKVYFCSDLEEFAETEYYSEIAAAAENENFTGVMNHPFSILKEEASLLGNLINVLIENTEILKSKVTSKQKNVILDYQRFDTYREIVALYREKNRPASIGNISEKLNASQYFTINRNQEMIKELLNHYCRIRSVLY